MENINYIQEELKSLSTIVAGLDKVNVFTTPSNYFNNIAGNVLKLITKESIEDSAIIDSALSVPVGYFDQLAGNILQKINEIAVVKDNLEQFSAITLSKTNLFEVPHNYFEGIAKNVLAKIHLLKDDVQDETIEISELLANINKSISWQIPTGYFELLPNELVKKVQPATKIVSINKGLSFFKYAAAAIFIGVISVLIFKFSNYETTKSTETVSLENIIEKGIKMDDKLFDETLNNLSDEDIATYLKQYGSMEDLAILTELVDEETIPSEEAYFLVNNTLEKFLKEIDIKKLNN